MPGGREGSRKGQLVWSLPVAIGIAAGAVFLAVPEIDLAVARLFLAPDAGFVGMRLGWVRALRVAFILLFWSAIALCLAGLFWTLWRGRPQWLRLARAEWPFLAACLAAGPGLVANLVLKDNWGR